MMLLIGININICFAKENVFYTDSGIVLTQEQYIYCLKYFQMK